MGWWTSHRQRQAGRYARASYRLQVHETRRAEAMRQVELLRIRAEVRARLRELAVPPRPDALEPHDDGQEQAMD